MTDTLDRAERAFRDALAEQADAVDFAPLDPDALRGAGTSAAAGDPPQGAVRRWLPVAAAAAVLVVAVPVGVQLAQRDRLTGGAPAAAPAAVPAPAGSSRDEAAPRPPGTAGPQAPQPGFRWASMADVLVQVPQEWGYGKSLGPDWCVEGAERRPGDPTAPFVDVRPEGRAVRTILCPGPVPAARQAMHLTWAHADGPAAPPEVAEGWVRVSRAVGAVVLTVVAPLDQRGLADQVLASAQQVAVDHLGCPVVAPVTPASPDAAPADRVVADVVGEPVVLCQYDDLTRTAANLVGSRALQAVPPELLEAQANPIPIPKRGSCVPDARGETLVVVRWTNLDLEAWLRVPGCGPSLLQSARGAVPATTALCRAVFEAPLALPDGGQAGDLCFAARR